MKNFSILLLSAISFAGILDDSSNQNVHDVERILPKTIVVKNGEVIGSLEVEVKNDQEAELIVENTNFPEGIQVAKERSQSDYLSDSSQDSYYYYRGYYYYNGPRYAYGYYWGSRNFAYSYYYGWGGYAFYRYSYSYYYRAYPWRYRYYWW